MAGTITSIRVQFFDYLFEDNEGYICIATAAPDKKDFKQFFFNWPKQRNDLASFLEAASQRKNVWFCTSLLERQERRKEYCLPGSLVWADLDTCHPSKVEPVPPCVIESSPRRYQALWRLEEIIEPYLQEEYSKRIAYKYNDNGVDPSGWDLTQLLRVPTTFNYKYELEGSDVPEVKIIDAFESRVPVELFEALPKAVKASKGTADFAEEMPTVADLPDADNISYKYWSYLNRTAFKQLYSVEPAEKEDWSKALWRLINICFEAGMDADEVFSVALASKCNKYMRDNRPPVHLWEDVLRAAEGHKRSALTNFDNIPFLMPELVTDEEIYNAGTSFIDLYKNWAEEATDAISEYHELTAFILLSSVIAAGIRLDTSYGEMVPNLWGLILGDSTLTRKTTAMRMAMDILADVDPELILATDGSAEGLLTGLSTRPDRTSIFYKDEVSGFIDAINKKHYLAGMPETLTQLYDVPRLFTRRLRQETITITNPCFIFFGGGIRDKVYSLLTDEYILSGFLPRFLVVSGEADLSKIRRTGPGVSLISDKKEAVVQTIADLHERYNQVVTMNLVGNPVPMPAIHKTVLTEEAWTRYGDIETKMVEEASDSPLSMLALPTFERLSRSLLKMSMLLASAEKPPQEVGASITVEEKHVIQAAGYVQRWGRHTVDLLVNGGKTSVEKTYMKVLATIAKNPGITRSNVMQRHHLSKRDADDIFGTLEMRGQITATKSSGGFRLTAT